MSTSQAFTDVNQQVKKLTDRGLNFQNLKSAMAYLIYYGYFNIINGYKDLYIEKYINDKGIEDEKYKENVFFEEIMNLYNFDHLLRSELMGVLLDLEMHLKAVLSYVLAENFTSNQNQYLDPMNYKNNYASNSRINLTNTLNSIKDVANNSTKDPIKYHRDKYSNVPPWVVFKEVYFSTTINLVKFLKKKEKDELVTMFYSIDLNTYNSLPVNEQKAIKDFFMASLKMLKEYRNACAHGNRIYNLTPKDLFNYNDYIILNKILNKKLYQSPTTGIEYLLISISCLNMAYDDYIINAITKTVKGHQVAFPNYIDDIKKTIGLQIF